MPILYVIIFIPQKSVKNPLYGLVSDKFDLDKAEADNKAIEEAAAEAAKQ